MKMERKCGCVVLATGIRKRSHGASIDLRVESVEEEVDRYASGPAIDRKP